MFNKTLLFKNIESNYSNIINSDFLKFVRQDLIDRLEPLEKTCPKMLIIRDFDNIISNHLQKPLSIEAITNLQDEDKVMSLDKKYNIIIFPLGLHWTNDVQGFLAKCYSLLEADGILVANFFAAGSLKNLRLLFYQLEQSCNRPHTPHIVPLIQFDQATPLLQQAGFVENIIDMEKFELEFASPLKLMHALKNTANNNILKLGLGYHITKEMHAKILEQQSTSFIETVNVVTFIAAKNKNSIKLKKDYYNPQN